MIFDLSFLICVQLSGVLWIDFWRLSFLMTITCTLRKISLQQPSRNKMRFPPRHCKMRNANSVPPYSPLGHILQNWITLSFWKRKSWCFWYPCIVRTSFRLREKWPSIIVQLCNWIYFGNRKKNGKECLMYSLLSESTCTKNMESYGPAEWEGEETCSPWF